MDSKCFLTSTDLQTRRARCQHQLSFLSMFQLLLSVRVSIQPPGCNCGGAEIKVSVPLRYHQPTFHDNNFHRPRWSNVPSCNNCHLPRMSTYTVMSSCGARRSFLPCKEEDKPLHPCKNFQIKPRYICKHYTMFSCLSHSVNYHSLQARPKNIPYASL